MNESLRAGAWAARLVQDTYREGDRRRDEQFMENALLAWLESAENRRLFLRTFGVEWVEAEEISVSSQLSGDDLDNGRADMTFHYGEEVFRVELKLWAALTPAQSRGAYAELFIVPQGRVASIQAEVAGEVVGWEELFQRLAGPESTQVDELERLRAFYEGMAYGTDLTDWPTELDFDKLRELRAVGRAQLRELTSIKARSVIRWDAIDWFTCTIEKSGNELALDLKENKWWWIRPSKDSDWEPDTKQDAFDPDLMALTRAMGNLWESTVRMGLAATEWGTSELRLSDEDGVVFGRYFRRKGYAIEVLLTLGDHPDPRILGIVVWIRRSGTWILDREAWWPKDASASVDLWRKEMVALASQLSEGAPDGTFEKLEYAIVTERE